MAAAATLLATVGLGRKLVREVEKAALAAIAAELAPNQKLPAKWHP